MSLSTRIATTMCSFDASKCVNLRRSFGWDSPGSYSCVRRRPSHAAPGVAVSASSSTRYYGRDLDASFRRRRSDDALPFFCVCAVPRYVSVRKFVISLIGSSENHTWKVHAFTSRDSIKYSSYLIKMKLHNLFSVPAVSF
jgi:hypothetical protein